MPDTSQQSSAHAYDAAATARLADRLSGGHIQSNSICEALHDGADPNWRNAKGQPLLNILASKNDTAALEAALAAGADVHATDADGNTAIFEAYYSQTMLTLLMAGADPHHRNNNNSTAYTHLPREHTNPAYRSMVLRTSLLVQDAELIATAANTGRLGPETYFNLWPKNAHRHPPPRDPLPHNDSLVYFLQRMEQEGKFMPKSELDGQGVGQIGLRKAIRESESSASSWQLHCDKAGTPMTVQDWAITGIFSNSDKSQHVACLFTPEYWGKKETLKDFIELFEAVPAHVFAQPSERLANTVNNTLYSWLQSGPGKDLSAAGVSHFRRQLPEQMRGMFTSYFQILSQRGSNNQGTEMGR